MPRIQVNMARSGLASGGGRRSDGQAHGCSRSRL